MIEVDTRYWQPKGAGITICLSTMNDGRVAVGCARGPGGEMTKTVARLNARQEAVSGKSYRPK